MYCSLHPYDEELLKIEYNIISRQAEQEIGWAQFLKARHIAEHKREWEERLQDYYLPEEAFQEMLSWLQRAARQRCCPGSILAGTALWRQRQSLWDL